MNEWAEKLDKLASKGLVRSLIAIESDGDILNFSSNDYLNLAGDDRLKAASIEAITSLGCSASASRLMSGNLNIHAALEDKLANFLSYQAALIFGSGFLANIGVLPALASRGDTIFADRLVHASCIDGIKLSGAKLVRYRHNDLDHLETLLKRDAGTGRRLLVTESLFSMDGDIAPLADLRSLANKYNCLMVVDEAHAIGVLGPGGRGVSATLAKKDKPDIVIGTLSKALGCYGGFAVMSHEIKDVLINSARSFIYSTALPPACAAGAITALNILQDSPHMGMQLLKRASEFRRILGEAGIETARSCSQIIPLHIGDNSLAMSMARHLKDDGIWAVAIRPPTVPAGTSRLRLAITLAHKPADLARTAQAIIKHYRELSIFSDQSAMNNDQ